jgi:4-amino-4-deoxy-L-arabinose transferase-like glycosyltransferase
MRHFFREEVYIILALLLATLIGFLVADDYGISWDEPHIYNYGEYAINAYGYFLHPQDLNGYVYDHLNFYGPVHFMLARSLSRTLIFFNSAWSVGAANHFIYYVTFVLSVLAFYLLSKRWMSKAAAFGSALLFATQPILFGHAFINPKDAPFMAFFLGSVFLGLRIFDDRPKIAWHKVLLAGIILGLTTSIRVIAPMAGVLVLLYGLFKSPRTVLKVAPFYAVTTILVMYLTWPYIWKAPVANFFESIRMMSDFPFESGVTLFMGAIYPIDRLPLRYIPSLLALQITEPALILISIGAVVSIISLLREKKWEPSLLFAGWFLAPTLWLILSDSALYDNARQLLFLWPPLFIVAGIGLDRLFKLNKSHLWKATLILIALLPGVYACMHLHPYQYIYYNSLAGGVGGAARQYELDYWGTSFKEATEYINQNADPGTQVVVTGARTLSRLYARSDLAVIGPPRLEKNVDYFYSLCLTRDNADLDQPLCRQGELVYVVERDGGVLSYVKKHVP